MNSDSTMEDLTTPSTEPPPVSSTPTENGPQLMPSSVTDFHCFIPVVNRFELLNRAIQSVPELTQSMTIIDNSLGGIDYKRIEKPAYNIQVMRPPVPLSYSQSLNWAATLCVQSGKKFLVNLHSDAYLTRPEAPSELLEFGRNCQDNWGVIWTFYDILCLFNPKAIIDVGGYDTNFPDYFTDNDMRRRMELAGYKCIDTGIQGVHHEGSATINSDTHLKYLNGVTFPLRRSYYISKWGGEPGKEIFRSPFNLG